MKLKLVAFSLLLGVISCAQADDNAASAPTTGMPAPKYLSVPHFKQCLGTQMKDQASFYCMPASKPQACPDASWQQLQNINASQPFDACTAPNA